MAEWRGATRTLAREADAAVPADLAAPLIILLEKLVRQQALHGEAEQARRQAQQTAGPDAAVTAAALATLETATHELHLLDSTVSFVGVHDNVLASDYVHQKIAFVSTQIAHCGHRLEQAGGYLQADLKTLHEIQDLWCKNVGLAKDALVPTEVHRAGLSSVVRRLESEHDCTA